MSRPVRLALQAPTVGKLAKGRHGTDHSGAIRLMCGLWFITLSGFSDLIKKFVTLRPLVGEAQEATLECRRP